MPIGEATIGSLGTHLVGLGWKSDHAEFGRQSWAIPTTGGHAEIAVRVQGNGIVGAFRLIGEHTGDEPGALTDDPWETEDMVLELGPENSGVHRSESEIANGLARFATLLATTVEREE